MACPHRSSTVRLFSISASRLGLDPAQNRFHAPIVYHEQYSFDGWPEKHTFPMDKFARLAHAVLTTQKSTLPSSNLPRPLVRRPEDMFRPLEYEDVPTEWFVSPTGPIDADFFHRFTDAGLSTEEKRWIGFREQCDNPALIRRTVLEVAGTVLTSQLAFKYGIASNLAGGTHHARRDMGAGYTILNDLAVAAKYLAPEKRVLVIDCDVHQGDGTATFDQIESLYTYSIHCASNYPHPKAHSTYDIGVADGIEDDEYLALLEESVEEALAQTRPDIVLYDAGVDVYRYDKLGRLKLSEDGIRRRDRWVLDRCVSDGIPVAAVIGGGYDKDVDALARRHAIVHEECGYVWRKHKLWRNCSSFS